MSTTTKGRRYSTRDAEPGWALRHSGSMQKHIAGALDLSASHVSRMVNEARESTVSRFLATVQDLMRHERTTPGPIIAEVMRAAYTAVRPYETAEIRELLYHAWEEETRWQGKCDVSHQQVVRALEDTKGEHASPHDLRRLADAQDALDEHARMEVGWLVVTVVLNHELRTRRAEG